jgi:hypothetical protein
MCLLMSCPGVIAGALPTAKQQRSPHFVNAQCCTADPGSKLDPAVESSQVVALSCSVNNGFLSLAAWVHSTCVMYFPAFFLLHLLIRRKVG